MSAAESVLGAMLLGGSKAYWRVADMLRPEDFQSAKHGAIYRAIAEVARTDADVDAITIGDLCETLKVASAADITRLASGALGASNVRAYADCVVADALSRRVRQVCQNGASTGDMATVQAELSSLLSAAPSKVEHVSIATKRMWDGVMARFASGEKLAGLSTGFPDLDAYLGGLQPCRVYGFGARPKVGKTVLAMNIGGHVAVELKKHVAVFSLEMSAEELTQRMVCALAGVPSSALQCPATAEDHHWAMLTPAIAALKTASLYISDSLDVTIEEIEAQARQMKSTTGLDLLVIDYLGLMKLPKLDRHDLSLGHVTRRLKAIAKALNIPVIIVFQLNRGSEQGAKPRIPIASDARDSGSIEQDLDAMMLAHRPSYYDKTAEKGLRLEVVIQRNGPTGVIRLEDDLVNCRFLPSDRQWVDPIRRGSGDDL